MRFLLNGAAITTLAFVLGAPVACYAQAADQTANATTATASTTDEDNTEVIVTAQRRNESVQKVPMTIQAFTAKTLADRNITTLDDLLVYTPNVEFAKNGPGQGNIYMRGLSAGFAGNQSQGTVGNFPNVAVYLDDQSMQFPSHNVDVYMADMNRVEILEGPQGTLFGGGAEAGALRYITNKPKINVSEGKVNAGYGITEDGAPSTNLDATINIPLIQDKFAIRGVVYNDRQGGYIDNVPSTFTRSNVDNNVYFGIHPTNGVCPDGKAPGTQTGFCTLSNSGQANNYALAQKDWNPTTTSGLRVSGLYQFNEDWDLLISESLQDLDSEGLAAEYEHGSDFQPLKPLEITSFSPAYDKDKLQNTAWTVDGKIGALKAIYTGAYTTRTIDQQMDYTNYSRTLYGQYYECTGGGAGMMGSGPLTCYSPVTNWHDHVRNTHLSNEFRVSTPDSWRLRGVAGIYHERFRIYDVMDFNYKTIPSCDEGNNLAISQGGGPVCVGNDQTGPGTTANQPGIKGDMVGFGEDVQRGYDQTAAFGSLDFDIIPNVLTVTAGTRYYKYDEYEKGSVYHTASNCVNVLACPIKADIDAEHLKVSYHGFKSRFGIQWKPADHTMFYYTYSEGFRPGGFSRFARDTAPDVNKVPQYHSPVAYAPDSLKNNEIGMKTEFFDRRLQLNLTAYMMEWKNAQIALYQPCCLGNTTFLVNGPDYDIKGLEAQFVARPIDGLTVQGSVTFNDNKQSNSPCLTDNEPNSPNLGKCITEVKGNPFPNPFGVEGGVSAYSPKTQANLVARYEWQAGDYNAFWSGDVSYTGEMFTQPANYVPGDSPSETPIPDTTYLRFRLPAYTTFGGSIGFGKDNWTVQLVGANLGNSHASTFTSTAQFIKSEVPLRPRTITLRISEGF